MITLIKKIAIRERPTGNLTDPAVSPYLNTVELVNVMEGVDGAATFGYSLETIAVQVEDNQTQQYKHIHTFDVRVLDPGSDNATIDGWIAEQKPVDIVGIGIDGYFQLDNVKLTRNKQYDEVFASAFLATAETLTSYTEGHVVPYWYYNNNTNQELYVQTKTVKQHNKLRAFAGANLYDIYDLDVSRSNISGFGGSKWMNGSYHTYTQSQVINTNIITSSISGSNVTLTRSNVKGSNSFMLNEEIFFPFADVPLTASINIVDINTNVSGSPAALKAQIIGGNGNIATSYQVNLTSSGRISFDFTTDSNTRVVYLQYRPGTERDSNITFDDIGIYPTAAAPVGGTKSIPTPNSNIPDPPID